MAGHDRDAIFDAQFHRSGSIGAAVPAFAQASVLRVGNDAGNGCELVGMENAAVGALAQDLVAATGGFYRGESKCLWIYANQWSGIACDRNQAERKIGMRFDLTMRYGRLSRSLIFGASARFHRWNMFTRLK